MEFRAKKGIHQAYSGVDLMLELEEAQRQIDALKYAYFQQQRANEELQLIQQSAGTVPEMTPRVPLDDDIYLGDEQLLPQM